MRSLFAKILLLFSVALLLTIAGFIVTTGRNLTQARGRGNVFARISAFQLEEARHAYEAGGKPALASFLQRFRDVMQADAALTDSEGRDLLTGEDRSNLIGVGEHHAAFPFVGRRRVVFAHNSEDGKYWFLSVVPRRRVGFSFLQPQYLWILATVVILSYSLAWYFTSPLRTLEKAVLSFGQGDFSVRVRSRRGDELGRLSRSFDEMAERLQTLLAAERRLLLDISHELRSPLARLSVAVELARSGEDREAALNRIEKEAERLNALVSELLQVTRAEGDPRALRTENVRLDELVSGVVEDCILEAQARGCGVKVEKTTPVSLEADPELLRRAFENVLRNAIRHAPSGSAVEVGLENTAGRASLWVRDYGPGVPAESLGRIFDAFYRVETDRNRESGGVGLGLSIARRAIELHKGTIQARAANPGLLVEIRLPIA